MEGIQQLQDQQAKLQQQFELEFKELAQLNKSSILDWCNLHNVRQIAQKIQIQQQRIELLRQELTQIVQGPPLKTIAALIIIEQPLSQVIFKGKVIEEPFTVHIITAMHQDIHSFTKVKASLVSDERQWKLGKTLENEFANMDSTTRIAQFQELKINVSTRMTPINLRFSVGVTGQRGAVTTVESGISWPIIVITNESQWCDAAGKLIISEAFSGSSEIPWPQFANALHYQFLKITKQDSSKPSRPFVEADWGYIHKRFFGETPTVNTTKAAQFWSWFGQVVCTIRFKRHINHLWSIGLIYGFISKESCTAALQNCDVGNFIVRFSESFPGLFAIAYVGEDTYDKVKHCIVKSDDLSANKTLPDFLATKSQFRFVCQYDIAAGTLKKGISKDTAFGPYYSKINRKVPPTTNTLNGYIIL